MVIIPSSIIWFQTIRSYFNNLLFNSTLIIEFLLAVRRCSSDTVSPSTRWASPLTSWVWSQLEMQYSFGTSWHILSNPQLVAGKVDPWRQFKLVIMAPFSASHLKHTQCTGHLPEKEPALRVHEVPWSAPLS